MFNKSERSTFKYWFAHWCAFNMTALNLGRWKLKHLFHDWYKPWLKLVLPYKKVQHFHRSHSNHHLEWFDQIPSKLLSDEFYVQNSFDWESMLIDWECSRFTKKSCPRDAQQELQEMIKKYETDPCNYWKYIWLKKIGQGVLKEIGLKKDDK